MTRFKLNREFIYDKYDTSSVYKMVDAIAAKSINGSHYWYNEFTHRVEPDPFGGSLLFATFDYHMSRIAAKYGEKGKDNVWFAPLQDVYEYLYVKNNVVVNASLSGNVLTIILDTNGLDGKAVKNALTLKIASDADFTVAYAGGFSKYSYRGTGSNRIVNIEWNQAGAVSSSLARMAGLEEPQTEPYVMYRVNAGGQNDLHPSDGVAWEADNNPNPAQYLVNDPSETRTSATGSSIMHDHSVPGSTPAGVFSTERALAWDGADSLKFRFPVSRGGEVEVRLFFAETEFEETNRRVFDIAIQDKVEVPRYDIYADAGKNKGVVKSFRATSDGAVDINLIRIRNNPSLRGIEILCLNNRCNTNDLKFSRNDWNRRKPFNSLAYPNPFADKLTVDFAENLPEVLKLQLFNNIGDHIRDMEISLNKGSEMELDFSSLPVGIYFLKILSDDKVSETIKIVKQ